MFTRLGFGHQIVVLNQMDTLFCHLLPKIIKPPTLGQTLYLDSHREGGDILLWFFVYKIKISPPTSLLLFNLVRFSFWYIHRGSFATFIAASSSKNQTITTKQSNPNHRPHLIIRCQQCQQNFALIRNQAAWESDDLCRKVGNLKPVPRNAGIPTMYVINTKTGRQVK